jgi:hypothetical protein
LGTTQITDRFFPISGMKVGSTTVSLPSCYCIPWLDSWFSAWLRWYLKMSCWGIRSATFKNLMKNAKPGFRMSRWITLIVFSLGVCHSNAQEFPKGWVFPVELGQVSGRYRSPIRCTWPPCILLLPTRW